MCNHTLDLVGWRHLKWTGGPRSFQPVFQCDLCQDIIIMSIGTKNYVNFKDKAEMINLVPKNWTPYGY